MTRHIIQELFINAYQNGKNAQFRQPVFATLLDMQALPRPQEKFLLNLTNNIRKSGDKFHENYKLQAQIVATFELQGAEFYHKHGMQNSYLAHLVNTVEKDKDSVLAVFCEALQEKINMPAIPENTEALLLLKEAISGVLQTSHTSIEGATDKAAESLLENFFKDKNPSVTTNKEKEQQGYDVVDGIRVKR